MRTIRVLHVCDALGGGVASAIEEFVRSTPEVTHALLGQREGHLQTADGLADMVDASYRAPTSRGGWWRSIRGAVHSFGPSIIHAHSSFAGLYTRMPAASRGVPVLYSPHGYAFERTDISPVIRSSYEIIERVLGRCGNGTIAVGLHEGDEAGRLAPNKPAWVVPNIPPDCQRIEREHRPSEHRIRAVMVGRVCPQKAPEYLMDVVGHCHEERVEFVWVGGGDAETEHRLQRAGVRVTGWLSRSDAIRELHDADVYIHTAAWEAAPPISMLEAAALGLPILPRRIVAYDRSGLTTVESAAEMAAVLCGTSAMADWENNSIRLLEFHNRRNQAESLMTAYREALSARIPESSSARTAE